MAMTLFTAWQYLLIDAANNFGLDKLLFEERIQWATENLSKLEALIPEAKKKTRPLYIKAAMAIRKAQASIPTGHLVGFDAVCSGIQIMSAMTGCIAGATATGLVDPNVRADAYTACTKEMEHILGDTLHVSREDAKQGLMTSFYGSKKTPKDIFGEKTPELNAFYQAAFNIAPGAWELLQDLLASWQPYALQHAWKLPDGFDARVKVMQKKDARIEVDELDHATFTYEFYENIGSKSGLSNVANMTHSMDAYVLRTMHRRCNYDLEELIFVEEVLDSTLSQRLKGDQQKPLIIGSKVAYYVEQYERSTLADVVILPYLGMNEAAQLSTDHLKSLSDIVNRMRQHRPFELVTVHDEFKAHANNMNRVRYWYKEILAEIADSNVLDDLLSQIHGTPGTFKKLSSNLGDLIRQSNYGLS